MLKTLKTGVAIAAIATLPLAVACSDQSAEYDSAAVQTDNQTAYDDSVMVSPADDTLADDTMMDQDTTTEYASTDEMSTDTAMDTQEPVTVIAAAEEAGQFTTLIAALNAAGLTQTLEGEGPYTIFAPTDAAFDQLPEGTLDELMKPENQGRLTEILTFHMIHGEVTAGDIASAQADTEKESLEGEKLMIKVIDGKVEVNNATVTSTDIQAGNGVIHVIDTVLIPETSA